MLGPRSQSRCLRCVYHSPPAILGVLLVWSYWTALVEITINWHLLERERIIAAILLAVRCFDKDSGLTARSSSSTHSGFLRYARW